MVDTTVVHARWQQRGEHRVQTRATTFGLRQLLCWIVLVLAGVFAALKHSLLAPNYFFDENRLIDFIDGSAAFTQDGSYRSTALLYRLLHVGGQNLDQFTVISYVAYAVLLMLFISPGKAARSWMGTALLAAAALLGAVYVAGITKEVFLIPILAILAIRRRSIWVDVAFLALAIPYGVYVRQYWLLVVAFYVMHRVGSTLMGQWRFFLRAIVPLMIALAIVFNLVLHVHLTYYRTSVIVNLSTDPRSKIVDLLASAPVFTDWLNGLYAVLILVIPFPLLALGPIQVVSFLVVTTAWVLFFIAMRGEDIGESAGWVVRCRALGLAYVTTLALFEPDYGSYLRHLTVGLPLLVGCALVGRTTTDADSLQSSLNLREKVAA